MSRSRCWDRPERGGVRLDGELTAHDLDGVRVVFANGELLTGVTKGKLLRRLGAGEELVEYVYPEGTDLGVARNDAAAGGAGAVVVTQLTTRLVDGRAARGQGLAGVGDSTAVDAGQTSDVGALSRKLAWLLRHGAGEAGLVMDTAGWANVADVLEALSMRRADLDLAVERNNKARLEVSGDRIRATQGHSLGSMPVTQEGLEASWQVVEPTTSLWHGTSVSATLGGIGEHGIVAATRTHVHLAESVDSVVGKRAGVDVLLEVDPTALATHAVTVFRSTNGVLLVREVPKEALVGVRAMSARGEAALGDMERALGLAVSDQ